MLLSLHIVYPILGRKGNVACLFCGLLQEISAAMSVVVYVLCYVDVAFWYSYVVVYWALKVIQEDEFERFSIIRPSHGKKKQ